MTSLTAADVRSPWVARAGRVGMIAAGVLYLTLAWLAAQVADREGTERADTQGALHAIAGAPLGKAALAFLAAGFAGYALWRFLVAALGEKVEAIDDLNWPKRLWYVVRGAIYLGLCIGALSILFGADEGGGSKERRGAVEIMSWPAGRWLVGAIGLAIVGYGLGTALRGVLRKFEDDLRTREMDPRSRTWFCRIGQVGWIGRGAVFALVGAFFVQAAIEFDPSEPRGLDGALEELARQSYGSFFLGAVAVGLAAYGLFQFVRARYREL